MLYQIGPNMRGCLDRVDRVDREQEIGVVQRGTRWKAEEDYFVKGTCVIVLNHSHLLLVFINGNNLNLQPSAASSVPVNIAPNWIQKVIRARHNRLSPYVWVYGRKWSGRETVFVVVVLHGQRKIDNHIPNRVSELNSILPHSISLSVLCCM